MEAKTIEQFTNTFDIVDNALKMRTLRRWNGRDLRDEENLSEHTHLVVASLIKLYDWLKTKQLKASVDFETMVIHAMLHDSLELFRGDILSITKDSIPGLRVATDAEEEYFVNKIVGIKLNDCEAMIVKLADLMACYKFVEFELRYPSNEFAKEAYVETKERYDNLMHTFGTKYLNCKETVMPLQDVRFKKGYEDDAGTDILLDRDIVFMPMSTTNVDLNVKITPQADEMSFLCARTSAASKGLSVATCPIDPYYNGNVTAIVHNMSNDIIVYKKGEAFCQYVTTKIITDRQTEPKKPGRRTTSKLGGTDK